jgi:dienelactone hydrolase
MKPSLLFIFLTCFCVFSKAQFHTGLKVYKEFDHTRIFDTIASSPMHTRPVKIDLFYPSSEQITKFPLTYGTFLNMYSERMHYSISQDSAAKVSNDLAKIFAEYLKLDNADQYIKYRTGVFADLKTPVKKYPLIIYAAGMNGSSWENIVLFDSLCRAGYVVAAVSSVGLFPGFMSTAPDIIEQVKDILFAKEKVSALPFVDNGKIGLLSWSLGGTAASKAAMLSNDFKCILSYDGTEIHYYGVDSVWDNMYDEMKKLEPSNASAIKIPYLYIGSDRLKASKMDNMLDHIASKDKYFVKITDGIHEDFSSIVTIANDIKPTRENADPTKTDNIWNLTKAFFDKYLKGRSPANLDELIDRLN